MSSSYEKIETAAIAFRNAILSAKEQNAFTNDEWWFCGFPKGCCGDTSELLAQYLKTKGIKTLYVWGQDPRGSHAWLVVEDELVNGHMLDHHILDGAEYVQDGLIIDITADQFGEPPIYVGRENEFYKRYSIERVFPCDGLTEYRLRNLYSKIVQFMPTDVID